MSVLSDEELLEILETRLPALLERHPEVETRVYEAFMRAFATKKEVAAVLISLQASREDLQAFRAEMRQCFEQVDQRFEQVEGEMRQGFEQVDQRFEQVDQRFDRVDQRFADLKDWVELVVGRLQTRSGRKLEDVVAGALRLALEQPDIDPAQIRLRQKITDESGAMGPAGRTYEVDILAQDGHLLVFEVKSVCEVEDVERHADKVELVRGLYPDKQVEGVMVALTPEPEVQQRCAALGLRLVGRT